MSSIEDQAGLGSVTPGPAKPLVCLGEVDNHLRIGRDEGNHIRLEGDLLVSGQHAEIIRRGSRTEIFDVSGSSGLGVYYRGRRVSRTELTSGTRFSIGRHDYLFYDGCVYPHDDMGAPVLHVDDLDVDIRKRKGLGWPKQALLEDVSFLLRERELLGIIGPSGSGKSTLLRAITGIVPATKGTTYYRGQDLYQNFAQLHTLIGLVPQEDVLHRQLKLRQALRYAAALRLPADVDRAERRRQVDTVMERLGLTERANDRIKTLSGGQRKRASVAIELLTKPTLLALDEPTTGLDPHLDRKIMIDLASLKDEGRTIIVVTHTPLHLNLCDHVLVLGTGGRIAYFGPPGETLWDFFEADSYTDVFEKVATDGKFWALKFTGSPIHRTEVSEPLAESQHVVQDRPDFFAPSQPGPAGATGAAGTPHHSGVRTPASVLADEAREIPAEVGPTASRPPAKGLQDAPLSQRLSNPKGALRNLWTLCMRMIAVILADRGYALLLLGVPPLLALLSHTIPGTKGLAQDQAGFNLEAQRLLIVLITGAAFMGLTNSTREIVKEEAIYRRDRVAGLSPMMYLGSKFAVLSVIGSLQSYLFVWLALLYRGAPADGLVVGPVWEIVLAVAAVAITSSALGLALGAVVRTPDQATTLLVVAVMAQLVLAGALFQITPGSLLDDLSWIDPSRWGFAAAAATTDLNSAIVHDPLWQHRASGWWLAMGVLVVHTLVLLALARFFLRRYEPGRRRWSV